jgi:histidinol-phosphatase
VDWWATLLALEIDGRAEVAMIYAAAMGRRWWATRGQGAWTTGPLDPSPRPLAVSRVDDLAGAHLAYGDLCLDPWFADLAGRCWRARGIGDFLMFCLLAEGALWTWRSGRTTSGHGAGRAVLLVTEAGGCVTDLAGRPWTEGQVAVASNRVLHAAVLASIPGPAGRDPHDPAGTRQLSPAPFPNPDTRDGSRAAVLP